MEKDASKLSSQEVQEMTHTIEMFNQELMIHTSEAQRLKTEQELAEIQITTEKWLRDHSL